MSSWLHCCSQKILLYPDPFWLLALTVLCPLLFVVPWLLQVGRESGNDLYCFEGLWDTLASDCEVCHIWCWTFYLASLTSGRSIFLCRCDWLVRNLHVSVYCLNIHIAIPDLFSWVLEVELGSQWFWGKHFNDWATSQLSILLYFFFTCCVNMLTSFRFIDYFALSFESCLFSMLVKTTSVRSPASVILQIVYDIMYMCTHTDYLYKVTSICIGKDCP